MDIEFLLSLQAFREGAGSFLTEFLAKMTWWGELNTTIVLIAIVYWCVNKSYGQYFLMGWSGNRLLNGLLKVTACAYRPWIRDARIMPNATAQATATGYSFPSGHTMNTATTFGGLAIRREFSTLLRVLLFVALLLVAFSRVFLGVHTPQDIIVGIVGGVFVMCLTMKLMFWLEAHPEKDLLVAGIGIALAIAIAIYAALKSYPVDYDAEGQLIVDGAKMALDTFKGTGWCCAFLIGWVLERRFVNFSTDITLSERATRLAAGLLSYYAVAFIVCPLIKTGLAGPIGTVLSCFLQMFYVVFLFPLFVELARKKFGRKVEAGTATEDGSPFEAGTPTIAQA